MNGGVEDTAEATVAVRVRGVYATALTRLLLDAGRDVVGASDPIRERFEAELPTDDHDVAVETTGERQGVGVAGEPAAVAAVTADLRAVASDAFAWEADAPPGAVFDGRVTGTRGDAEGYLPFDDADGYVETGDAVRVQVAEGAPPWADRRPQLDATLRAGDGLATLVRGRAGTTVAGGGDATARELAGVTDMLDASPPEGWGVEWEPEAADADVATLSGALDRAMERARGVEAALGDDLAPPRALAAPAAATWVWFGRDSRFALDEHRAAVTTTMPGHHRTKAAAPAASAAVDFVEALCDPGGEFPFDAVTRQFGPAEGDRVAIGHGKPDGRLLVLGRGEVVDRDPDGTVAVERTISAGGTYDALGVERAAGDTAHTTFREGRRWYPTVYRDGEGEPKGTYVNVCTPVECFPETIRYVDLHVDVVKRPGGDVERVDDDELAAAVEAGELSEPLAETARSVATAIERAL